MANMDQASKPIGRRGASLLMAGAVVPWIGPRAARADDVTPIPQVATPPAAPATAPAVPPAAPPAAPPLPVRPPSGPAPAIDRSKLYYVFFDQGIDVASMRALRRQLTTLVEAGVPEITIILHSAGGLIDPMLVTYSFIRALPARIHTHAVGFVQSAATVLFLAGQRRSADRTARFLFHPSQLPVSGPVTSAQLQDRTAQFDALAGVSGEILRDRTTLPDQEIARFAREQVILTAEQAKAAGILQSVADLRIPGDQAARVVFLD